MYICVCTSPFLSIGMSYGWDNCLHSEAWSPTCEADTQQVGGEHTVQTLTLFATVSAPSLENGQVEKHQDRKRDSLFFWLSCIDKKLHLVIYRWLMFNDFQESCHLRFFLAFSVTLPWLHQLKLLISCNSHKNSTETRIKTEIMTDCSFLHCTDSGYCQYRVQGIFGWISPWRNLPSFSLRICC